MLEVQIIFGGTTIRIAPIALLLTVFVASAASAQIIGERPVSTPIYVPPYVSERGAMASDGTRFLAAWVDVRDGATTYAERIYAARIDGDGRILDPLGILVANIGASPPIHRLNVVWSGDSYLVVWNESNGVMAARIAPDGQIADPPRVILPGTQMNSAHPIAVNGNVSVVMSGRGYSVLDNDLRVVDSGAFSSSSSSYASVYPTGSGGFTLIVNSGTVIVTSGWLRLDASGHLAELGSQSGPADVPIACHGNDCIQVFGNFANSTSRLSVASYDPAAHTRGPAIDLGIVVSQYDVVAIANGFLLFSSLGVVQRFDGQARPLGPPISLSWQGSAAVTAASSGRDAAVLRWTGSTLSVAIVTPSAVGDPRNVATSANAQQHPAIATDGSNYLVAWAEKDGIYAGRLSLDGTALDGRGRLISASTQAPAVASDGASYFVSIGTPDGRSTTIVRIDPSNGATLATRTICGNDMRIASNGSATIAVWADCAGGIVTAFIDANGAPSSIPVILGTGPNWVTEAHPAVAWNGTLWLVTWEEQAVSGCPLEFFLCPLTTVAIRGARLSDALTPIDTKPITISENYNGSIESSRLASDGHNFFAAWTDHGSVHARCISASGEALDDQRLFGGSGQDLIWDGAQYDLAFSTSPDYASADLAVAHLRPSGQAFETLVISATPDDERSASLVSLGNGRVVAAYTRVAHEPLYGGVERAFIAAPRPARGRAARTESR
jgi:hypothetical protein